MIEHASFMTLGYYLQRKRCARALPEKKVGYGDGGVDVLTTSRRGTP